MSTEPGKAAQPLTTSITAWLKLQIEQRQLRPGDKLPSEKQLCAQFSVSRSVVREAVSQLKSEGLVSSHQGRGVFVNERGKRQSFRLDPTQLNDEEDLAYVLELLITIEVAATRLAAIRRTPEDLKRIKHALIDLLVNLKISLPDSCRILPGQAVPMLNVMIKNIGHEGHFLGLENEFCYKELIF